MSKALNELKCCEEWANILLRVEGYDSIFKCRDEFGGGVALLINKNLRNGEIFLENTNATEIVGAKIELSDHVYNVFSYYNSPSANLNVEILSNICKNYENFVHFLY